VGQPCTSTPIMPHRQGGVLMRAHAHALSDSVSLFFIQARVCSINDYTHPYNRHVQSFCDHGFTQGKCPLWIFKVMHIHTCSGSKTCNRKYLRVSGRGSTSCSVCTMSRKHLAHKCECVLSYLHTHTPSPPPLGMHITCVVTYGVCDEVVLIEHALTAACPPLLV
jgi:hypothetical protein